LGQLSSPNACELDYRDLLHGHVLPEGDRVHDLLDDTDQGNIQERRQHGAQDLWHCVFSGPVLCCALRICDVGRYFVLLCCADRLPFSLPQKGGRTDKLAGEALGALSGGL